LFWRELNGYPINRPALAWEKKGFVATWYLFLIPGGCRSEMAICCREKQFWKHLAPISMTESGIVRDDNDEHLEKQ
jgi:hypothetical protein